MATFLSDDISDVFDPIAHLCSNQDDDKVAKMETRLPTPRPVHTEPCAACRGTGRWVGNYRSGHCFKCKGTGKLTFKSAPEAREKARASAARRKAEREVRRQEQALQEAELWKTEYPTEHAWIMRNMESFPFARSMHDVLHSWGSLSENQMAAVRRCVARDAEKAARASERVATAPKLDVSRIEAAFEEARKRAQRPGQMGVFTKPLRLAAPDGTGLQFRPGSAGSQWEGMLFVRTEDGKKLGHVKNGVFSRKFDCTEAEQAAVVSAASDPEAAIIAYAKAYSRCGVCGRGLLNDVSIERGIGPICASRFGFFGS